MTEAFRAEVRAWLAVVRALAPAWGSQAEHRARVLRELSTGAGLR